MRHLSLCVVCADDLPENARVDCRYCSVRCRMRAHRIRAGVGTGQADGIQHGGNKGVGVRQALRQAQEAAIEQERKLALVTERATALQAEVAALTLERDRARREGQQAKAARQSAEDEKQARESRELRQAKQRLGRQETALLTARAELKQLRSERRKASAQMKRPASGLAPLQRKLKQAEERVAEQAATLRKVRRELTVERQVSRNSQRRYLQAVATLRTEQDRRKKLAQRLQQQTKSPSIRRVVTRVTTQKQTTPYYSPKPTPVRMARNVGTQPRYSAKVLDGMVRMVTAKPSLADVSATKAQRAESARRQKMDSNCREAIVELTAKGNAARQALLNWLCQQGYDAGNDQLVLLKVHEMQAENELAIGQTITGRRVTAREIPAGTDVMTVAALWAIEAREYYFESPPKRRKTDPYWQRQYCLLDPESEDDLQSKLVKSMIKLRQKLHR